MRCRRAPAIAWNRWTPGAFSGVYQIHLRFGRIPGAKVSCPIVRGFIAPSPTVFPPIRIEFVDQNQAGRAFWEAAHAQQSRRGQRPAGRTGGLASILGSAHSKTEFSGVDGLRNYMRPPASQLQ
jgi:hypothetical protein